MAENPIYGLDHSLRVSAGGSGGPPCDRGVGAVPGRRSAPARASGSRPAHRWAGWRSSSTLDELRVPRQIRPVGAVPQQRQPAAGHEHPRDLPCRFGRPEPVEALTDAHRIDGPVSTGIASAVPSRASISGSRSRSTPIIEGEGSTAITRPAWRTSARVSLPVPAARSSTVLSGPSPSSRLRFWIAAGGYVGRPRSYASAEPKPLTARGSTVMLSFELLACREARSVCSAAAVPRCTTIGAAEGLSDARGAGPC